MNETPELRIGNTLYRFQSDMKVFAVQILNELLHDARIKLYAEALKAGTDGKPVVDGLEVTKQFFDIEHEILRGARYGKFIAACIAEKPDDVAKLEKEVALLPYELTRPIYDFFFSSGTMLSLIFPGFSFAAKDQDNEIRPMNSSTSSPTATPEKSNPSE